jgi:hypothetical protein
MRDCAMTPFEYVTVLISIILGMGITQIVTGVADLAHQWHQVRIYWPHLLWIILVFFLHIDEWWATYELRQFESLRLPTFLFVLLYPINLFILARILFPLIQPDREFDLKIFYYASYRKFFLWASMLPVLSLLNNVLITGHPVHTQVVQFTVFAVLLFLATRKKIDERIHKISSLVLVAMMLIVLALRWNESLTS